MNILLIEDNETIIKGLEYSFFKNGYKITSKMTVKDSTEYLKENLPDIIILDVSLPDGDGFCLFENVLFYIPS